VGGQNVFLFELDAWDPGPAELRADYEFHATLTPGEGKPTFNLAESGKGTFAPAGRLELVQLTRPEARARMGSVLGIDEDVRALSLRFERR
jgi:hypothetical protein